MAFKMKGSPFKQASLKKVDARGGKITGDGNKKAKDKPKEKTVTDFAGEKEPVNNPFDTSSKHRTWKDFHGVEKGAALFVGGYMVPSAIVNTVKAFMKK
jgi:hypothetical protein